MRENKLPLRGKHVLITRGGEQGKKFCSDVATAGGIPYMIPLIDFRSHQDISAPLFIGRMLQYDWIIFTSKNGVDYFFKHIKDKIDQTKLRNSAIQFAVVGEKTREALDRYGFSSRFMPNVYTAEDFAREYFQNELSAKKVLIPKGNLASTTIADSFRTRGMVADEWIVYDTYFPSGEKDRLAGIISAGRLDVAAFTSPSTFNHFKKIIDEHHLKYMVKNLKMAAIGTVTKRAIEQDGYSVDICPETFTINAMFAELCQYFAEQERNE